MELGVTIPAPPLEVRVETYLSRNARVMRLPLPRVDTESVVTEEPLNGARASDWQLPDIGIVVDDLDPGFSFVSPPERGFRIGLSSDVDGGEGTVPEYDDAVRSAPGWHRQGDPQTTAWGKYRRTLMRILAGRGDGNATFTTELPAAGRWRLSYHLPGALASEGRNPALGIRRMDDNFGTYNLRIVAGEHARPRAIRCPLGDPRLERHRHIRLARRTGRRRSLRRHRRRYRRGGRDPVAEGDESGRSRRGVRCTHRPCIRAAKLDEPRRRTMPCRIH